MGQRDLSDMAEEMAILEEAGLKDLDWTKISEDLAYFEAEAKMESMNIISNLDPRETALFHGMAAKSNCSVHEKRKYRRHTYQVFRKLLDMGFTTILVEDSTIFGFFSLGELIRLRRRYEFALMIIHRKAYTYQWQHISNKELSRYRHLKSVRYYAICDKLLGAISREVWLDICINHIAVAITEKPPYFCNLNLTEEQCRTMGCPAHNKMRKLRLWLLREDERMKMYAK